MKTVKCACINSIRYCKYPQGICSIEEFIKYLNENFNTLLKFEMFEEDGCVAPYFIEEKTGVMYYNPSTFHSVNEAEVKILTEEEYNEKLKEVIRRKCVHCKYYSKDTCKTDCESHRGHISLDGECFSFEKKN